MNWRREPFESLFSEPTRNGLTRPSGVRGEGYRMINMGEIFGHDRISDIEMERVQLNDRELATMLVREGDLLFARQSLVLAGAGKCTLVEQVNEPTTFESHIIRVRLDPKKADPRFYHYLFQSPYSGIKAIVTQGVQAGIRASDLAVLKVPVPDPDEQRRIAAVLSSYDDLIENNRKRIKLLERAARLLYTEWFVRGRFPGHQGVKVKDGVPEGWEKKGLHEVAQVSFGFPFASNLFNEDELGIPVIRIRDIPVGYSKTYTTEEPSPDYFVEDGDVLIGMDGDFHMRQWSGGTSWLNQRVTRLRGKDGISNALIRQVIDAPIKFLNNTITGTTVRHLSAKHLKEMKVLMPTGPLLKEASERFDDMGRMIIILERSIAVLTRARDLLLPRLMSGKVKV